MINKKDPVYQNCILHRNSSVLLHRERTFDSHIDGSGRRKLRRRSLNRAPPRLPRLRTH